MLKTVLIANAASCALFGVVFLTIAGSVATFLGDPPFWLLQVLGAGLLFNAAHLIYAARQNRPNSKLVLYFTLGDALWVLATAGLIATGTWITTSPGIAAAIAVGAYVGLCGIGQWRAISSRAPQAVI
ncbi:MAG: hypothetical protein ACI861_002244 [Paracoccaceae bacterium]|jgi:hypothetical protein